MTLIRVAIALAFAIAARAVEPVRAWQASITLPTWEEGPADPVPHFGSLGADRPWYPYPARTNLGAESRKQSWRTLNIENEYLTCIVLPDLGGHLYSCKDKLSGYEMFHANPSIKKGLIGLRGAWAALGVELNFPVTHSLLTVSPVEFRLSQTTNVASIWVGATDRVSGMRWSVEFSLERGAAALRQSVRLENPTAVRRRYSWWTNAGVTLNDDTQFVLPTRLVANHGRTQIDTWPVAASGLDRSHPAGFPSSAGWFAYESREPFLAVFHPRTHTGTLHYADPAEMPCKKIWAWGRDEDRQIRAALSDDDSQYVEIQAGLFENQEIFQFLEPSSSRSFTEYWLPVRKLDGISQAGTYGVLYFARNAGVLAAQFLPAGTAPGAKARILCGAKTLVDEPLVLDPARPWTRVILGAPAGACRFQLLDAAGKPLLEYTEGEIRGAGPQNVKLGARPAVNRSQLSLENGQYFESQGDLPKAAEAYSQSKTKTPAGRLAAAMNRFEEAAALLASAADAEAHYYRGVALAALGSDDDARREWSDARSDPQFGLPAAIETAAAMARAGEVQRAIAELAGPTTPGVRSLVMAAALARAAGDAVSAKASIARAASLDPADSAVRFEEVREGAADPQLWEQLAADPERVLELADLYLHWGRYKDALQLLSYSYPVVPPSQKEPGVPMPQDYALLAYYRGYCHQKLNEYSAEDFRLASTLPVRYVFPGRPVERRVLETALQANSGDASAHYLLGLWYLNAHRVAEGSRELQAAQKLRPEFPEARALLAVLKLPVVPVPVSVAAPTAPPPAPAPPKEVPKAEPPKEAARPKAPEPKPAPASPLTEVPGWFAHSPDAVVNTALEAAANGDISRASSYFNRANFPDGKQPDFVRAAYIEVQLQRLLELAYARKCADADRGITTLGFEDKSVPFTFNGFGAFMKGARFQYQIALVEAACVDEKDARRRWEKVSKMHAALNSPDFAYSYMALAKLGPVGDLGSVVRQVEAAMPAAATGELPVLIYSRGLLLWSLGRTDEAAAAFREGVAKAPGGMPRYLNQNALRTMTRLRSNDRWNTTSGKTWKKKYSAPRLPARSSPAKKRWLRRSSSPRAPSCPSTLMKASRLPTFSMAL
jgi:tetratricopeptide (TPR) repeat protein